MTFWFAKLLTKLCKILQRHRLNALVPLFGAIFQLLSLPLDFSPRLRFDSTELLIVVDAARDAVWERWLVLS